MQASLPIGDPIRSEEGAQAEGGSCKDNSTLARIDRQKRLSASLRLAQRIGLLAQL